LPHLADVISDTDKGKRSLRARKFASGKPQGCIFFYRGGGKESKGLRAREENQRRVEKMERQREKKRKIPVGNS
jgi:hypothetical protein